MAWIDPLALGALGAPDRGERHRSRPVNDLMDQTIRRRMAMLTAVKLGLQKILFCWHNFYNIYIYVYIYNIYIYTCICIYICIQYISCDKFYCLFVYIITYTYIYIYILSKWKIALLWRLANYSSCDDSPCQLWPVMQQLEWLPGDLLWLRNPAPAKGWLKAQQKWWFNGISWDFMGYTLW